MTLEQANEKLKPCPFCGGKAEVKYIFGRPGIKCNTWGCYAFMRGIIGTDKEMIIEAWNRRTSDDT